MVATPKVWVVCTYVESNGWAAILSGQRCNSLDEARQHARRCARNSPGVSYVVFEAKTAWHTDPGNPVEEPL